MPEYSFQRYRGVLAIVWVEEGRRRRYSLGTADRTAAEAAARNFWKRRSANGLTETVGQAVDRYIAAHSDMLSIKRARQAWKAAGSFWADLPIARIDKQAAIDYRARRAHCAAITVRNELAVIRAALNWAKKEALIPEAPFIQMPSLPRSTIGHISKAQFRQLKDGAATPHIKLFMMLAVATGARSNALLDLTWDRVDFKRNLITLNPAERVQTSKYRAVVPMNAQIREELLEAQAGAMSDYVIEYGRGKVASVKKGFQRASERSGIVCSPHMLRHSAAVWQAEAGIPIFQIAQFLGHSDSRITERTYARFAPEFLATAAEALTW